MEVVEKPWGRFITYAKNEQVTVKILQIDKGEETSLQSHRNRDEEWFVLSGRVRVQTGHSKDRLESVVLAKGGSIKVPRGMMHRTSALDETRLLEISRGNFDENDIIRHDDRYGRAK